MILVLGILWGGGFMFSGVALKELPPFTIVASRVFIAAVVLNLLIVLSGRHYDISLKRAGEFLLMGLLNNAIPFTLIVWGQTQITAGLASILNAATPLFSFILAHMLTKDEKLTPMRLVGVLVGISAVVILVGPGVVLKAEFDPLPQLAVLGAALSYSVGGIFGKRFGREGVDPLVVSGGQLTASSLILIPLALLIDKPWLNSIPGPSTILAVIGLAVLSTAVAYLLYFRLLARVGAGNVSLVTMIIPFVAIILGSAVLGETIEIRELIAFGILILGLLTIDGRIFRHER